VFSLKHYNIAYVRWVEELLAESLTSYVKQKDDNTFTRRTNKRCVSEGCNFFVSLTFEEQFALVMEHSRVSTAGSNLFVCGQDWETQILLVTS